MGEAAKGKTKKASWFKGMKAEFNKISWPDQKSLTKQTVAVLIVALILGVTITIMDFVIRFGIGFLVK